MQKKFFFAWRHSTPPARWVLRISSAYKPYGVITPEVYAEAEAEQQQAEQLGEADDDDEEEEEDEEVVQHEEVVQQCNPQ